MSRQPSKRPDWSGRTAVVMASGPSLTARDAQLACFVPCGPVKVIAVNATAFVFPWWDVAYSGDFLFFKTNSTQLRGVHNVWTCDRASSERWGLNWVKGVNRGGLGLETVHMNGNSGAQAVNLAYLFGARRIILLGFDMKLGPKGERHHHPDHPSPCVQAQLFEEWIHKFKPLADDLVKAGCQVINCTPGSALPWFERADLNDVLSVKENP